MAKKHSFFLWQSKTPPKKNRNGNLPLNWWFYTQHHDKLRLFFHLEPLGFHQQEDMIGVYWYAANRLVFLSVDINHLPFTINQFFLNGFYISLGISLSIGIYVWSVLMIQTTRFSVTGMMDIGFWGSRNGRDFPAIFRLVNCSLTRIYADVLSYFTTQARPSNYSALAEIEWFSALFNNSRCQDFVFE